MAKKKLGESVLVLDTADKAFNTPIPKTLLERFEEEIDWLVDVNGSYNYKERYLAAIANQDYIKASEYQHQMMVLQYHQGFVPRLKDAITSGHLDALMLGLMNTIMSPSFVSDRPRPAELANLDAAREQWKLVTKILKARDKEAIANPDQETWDEQLIKDIALSQVDAKQTLFEF